jgi:integrase
MGRGERPRVRGEGRAFRRGKTYWIAYYCRLDGEVREVRESAHTDDEAEAWKILQQRAGKARDSKADFDPRAERVTFDDLAAAFVRDYKINGLRSIEQAERNVRRLRRYFGGRRALDIDTDQVEAYKDQRLEAGAKPATINRELAALKRMFSLAMKGRRGFHYRPYIALLDEENTREGFFEPADFWAVCKYLAPDLADLAMFAYLTGWRKGEVLGLEWRNVTLDRRGGAIVGATVTLPAARSKNKKGRKVVLRDALLDGLLRRVAVRRLDCPYVFHRDGTPVRSFRRAWLTACKQAGVEGKVFHDLRRSGVRNMVRAGVPELVAMRISGHRTRSVFDRYDITSEADLEAAAEQTSRYVAEKCTEAPLVVTLHTEREKNTDKNTDNGRDRVAPAIATR